MSSTIGKIPQAVWESHKETILELYREMSQKEVQKEMRDRHGFRASHNQYQSQFKRWQIRKNRTEREWQQCLSTSDMESHSMSVPGVTHRKVPASSKRAQRWVSRPFAADVPQCSSSRQPATKAQQIPTPIPNEPVVSRIASQADVQVLFSGVAEPFSGHEGTSLPNEPLASTIFTTGDLQSSSQQALMAAMSGLSQSSDFNIMASTAWQVQMTPDFQSLGLEPDSFDSDFSPLMDLPRSNNVTFFFPSQDATFSRDLPFASLEHIMRSNGIMTENSLGVLTYSGFASRALTAILPSRERSVPPQSSDLQLLQGKLGSLIPGESFDLTTDSQAFETNFIRMLVFSMLNGFSGLSDVPVEDILRFLHRVVVNKLFFDILGQCPPHVLRTLADNIFRAAIEATDVNAVELLLSHGLVDANETECFHEGGRVTPIERAASLGSLDLIRILISGNADVNKSYTDQSMYTIIFPGQSGALARLVHRMHKFSKRGRFTVQAELVEAFHELVAAGARVEPNLIDYFCVREPRNLFRFICAHMHPESHRQFFEISSLETDILVRRPSAANIAKNMDDHSATVWFQDMIGHCNQLCSSECFINGVEVLRRAVLVGARTGKLKLVKLLVEETRVDPRTHGIFTASIASQSYDLIEFILGFGPDLDPPATDIHPDSPPRMGAIVCTTPIAEAVRYGNKDLIQKLEAGHSLDHLDEGGRFLPLLKAAIEAGNTDFVRKLVNLPFPLPQPITTQDEEPLKLAVQGGQGEILHLFLKAGASARRLHDSVSYMSSLEEAMTRQDTQMMRGLIEYQDPSSYVWRPPFRGPEFRKGITECSIVEFMIDEYPGFNITGDEISDILKQYIRTDNLLSFQRLLPRLNNSDSLLDDCLRTAVESRHSGLIEYLIDMGANPFNRQVLQSTSPDRPDLLRQLLKQEIRRQTVPICIGTNILDSVMGDGAGNSEALNLLLQTHAIDFIRLEELNNPDKRLEEYALTPLGLAIHGSHQHPGTNMGAVEKFLQAGADPNGIAKANVRYSKCSPLMTALVLTVATGKQEVVKMLLRHGALVDARPRLGTTRTALQHAAEKGNSSMVNLLLQNLANADDAAPPRGGATALQFAAMSGNLNMAYDLLAYGAKLGALPSRIDGRWPLEGAAEAGRLDMISFLWKSYLQSSESGEPCAGFSERQCLRAMNFARGNGHVGCADLISELSKIPVDMIKTRNYGETWMAYEIDYA